MKYQFADDDECVIGTGSGEISMELNAEKQVVVWIDGNHSVSLNVDEVGVMVQFLMMAAMRMSLGGMDGA